MGFELVPLEEITSLKTGNQYNFIINPIPANANYNQTDYNFKLISGYVHNGMEMGKGLGSLGAPERILSKQKFTITIPDENWNPDMEFPEPMPWLSMFIEYKDNTNDVEVRYNQSVPV